MIMIKMMFYFKYNKKIVFGNYKNKFFNMLHYYNNK